MHATSIGFRGKASLLLCLFFALYHTLSAQLYAGGGETPDPSARLDIQSTSQGVLVPRLTTTQRTSITSPANGLLVYDTNNDAFYYYNSGTSTWVNVSTGGPTGPTGPTGIGGATGPTGNMGATGPTGSAAGIAWGLTGNAGTTIGTNFIGTTDSVPFQIKVNNQQYAYFGLATRSMLLGKRAGVNNTGINNNAYGDSALYSNTSGTYNIAIGNLALADNTTGARNTGIGYEAESGFIGLGSNATASDNTAIGYQSMFANISSPQNTAVGSGSLSSTLSTGSGNNTAVGYNSMNETGGSYNTAIGASSFFGSGEAGGTSNTCMGYGVMANNHSYVSGNTIVGYLAYGGQVNSGSGNNNSALGFEALYNQSSGKNDIAVGDSAGYSNTTGSHNIFIGTWATDSAVGNNYAIAEGYLAKASKNQYRLSDSVYSWIGANINGFMIGETSTNHLLGVNGDIAIEKVGGKLFIKTGTNASMGTATLSSGTVTVSTSSITSSSNVFITLQNCSSCGTIYISAVTTGTSFVVTSSNGSDGSKIAWLIVEPD